MIKVIVIALLLIAWAPAPGYADEACERQDVTEWVQGVAQINTTYVCDGDAGGLADATPVEDLPPRESSLDPLCVQEAISHGVEPFLFCDVPAAPGTPLTEPTPGIVAAAFRRLPLPAARLVVQPPNGRTLVNFETNFYTEQGEFTRVVVLLGQRVELRVWPASFGWRFGDGATSESSSPGAAYPDLEVTHRYLRAGRVAPSVDVTYAAQFRVGGGDWRDVAGTVTIAGSPQSLRVVEARPVLVGG